MIIYKMNIKNKKSFSIKKLIIPVIALLVVSGGVYAYALSNDFFSPQPTNQDTSLPESPNDPVPEGPVPTDNTNKENLGEENPSESDGSLPGVVLTAAAITGDTLQVRALIQGVVNEGTCELRVTRDSQTLFSESAAVQAGPSTSTCRGFDVPLGETSNGPLSVSISYVSGSESSTSQISQVDVDR